jgi:E3 ubiquitin-protein ligase makorin
MNDYKKKLQTIPCKYFDYGRGACPFGNSCFYAHVNLDGSKASYQLRKWMDANAEIRIANTLK